MNKKIISDLIKVANSLDSKGFGKEADQLDRIIRKIAQIDPTLLNDIRSENEELTDQDKPPFTAIEIAKRFLEGDLEKGLEYAEALYPSVVPTRTLERSIEEIIEAEESLKKETIDGFVGLTALQIAELGFTPELAIEIHKALPAYKAEMFGASEGPRGCTPNGKPLLRIPGDRTYGYQLTDDNMGYQAWKLDGCEAVSGGREFRYTEGGSEEMRISVNKVREAAELDPISAAGASEGAKAPSEMPSDPAIAPRTDQQTLDGLEALKEEIENSNIASVRIRQDHPYVTRAEELLGISDRALFKKMSPLVPNVGYKFLLKQINRGIEKLKANLQGDSADDIFMSAEASESEQRIAKFASLLSGEFNGLDKKIRR